MSPGIGVTSTTKANKFIGIVFIANNSESLRILTIKGLFFFGRTRSIYNTNHNIMKIELFKLN